MTPFDPSTFHPQPDRVLAYLIKTPTRYGRIIMPLEAVQDTNLARLVAVGSNLPADWVGQAAVISQTGGTLVHKAEDRTYIAYHIEEILALIDDLSDAVPASNPPKEDPDAP